MNCQQKNTVTGKLTRSGDIGKLKTIVVHSTSNLFNGASHSLDVANRLNDDSPAVWVQADVVTPEAIDVERKLLTGDPSAHGIVKFENGVTAYRLLANGGKRS